MATIKLKAPSGGSVSLVAGDTASDVVFTIPPTTSTIVTSDVLAAPTGAGLVGYMPAGVGAVGRTLQDKGRESVSVLDFKNAAAIAGDWTTAIEAAIASVRASAASTVGENGSIFIPHSTSIYHCGNINVHGVSIVSDGAVLAPVAGASRVFYISDYAPQYGKERSTISGISFLYRNTALNAIAIGPAFNVLIKECSFQEWVGNAVYITEGESIWIHNCSWTSGSGGSSILALNDQVTTFTNGLTIESCRFQLLGGNSNYAYPAVSADAWNVNIVDSLFVGNRGGGVTLGKFNTGAGAQISGCYFENNGYNDKQHIRIGDSGSGGGYNGVSIFSNMLLGTGSSGVNLQYGILIDTAKGVTIENNQINNAIGNYTTKAIYTASATRTTDLTIRNNYFVAESFQDAVGGETYLVPGANLSGSETNTQKTWQQQYGQMQSVAVAGSASLTSTFTLYYDGFYEVSVYAYRSDGYSTAMGSWIVHVRTKWANAILKTNQLGTSSVAGDYTALTLSNPSGGRVVTATVTQAGTAYSSTHQWHVRMITPCY